jgi:FkbM family methyltransferase
MSQKTIKAIYNSIPFKRPLFEIIKRNFNLPRSIYHYMRFVGQFEVHVAKGRSFTIMNHAMQLENDIFWKGIEGGWEHTSMSIWKTLSEDAQIIMDVGANTGIYGLVSKTVNASSQVHAFEPVDRVFEKLILNQDLNNFDTFCNKEALSNYDGEAVIYDKNTDHVYSVTVNEDRSDNPNSSIPTTIATKRLDTYIQEHNIVQIDLMKIDVEAHEPEVLQGMGKYLKEFMPTMLIEILEDHIGAKVEEAISEVPYLFFQIDEKSGMKRAKSLKKADSWNYLLCSEKTALKLAPFIVD